MSECATKQQTEARNRVNIKYNANPFLILKHKTRHSKLIINPQRNAFPTFVHDFVHFAARAEHPHAELVDDEHLPAGAFGFDQPNHVVEDLLTYDLLQSHD